MAFETPSIVWNGKKILDAMNKELEKACKVGAGIIRTKAIENLESNIIKNYETSSSTGALADTISIKKSTFKDGGWIVGVFDDPTGAWEDTFGAQAIYVEYGHAFPYQGRNYVGRKNVLKSVPKYPFLGKAERSSRKKIARLLEKAINKAIDK